MRVGGRDSVIEAATALSRAVNLVARKHSSGSAEERMPEYLRTISRLYSAYGYLPLAYPAFAANYSFKALVSTELVSHIENIYSALGGVLADELDARNPLDAINILLTASVLVCSEASRGSIGLDDIEFNIGGVRVGVKGYCSLLKHIDKASLTTGRHEFSHQAFDFIRESLEYYVNNRDPAKCSRCRSRVTSISSYKSLYGFIAVCSDCYGSYRRVLTSRVLTAWKGLLTMLLSLKWAILPSDVIGITMHAINRLGRAGGIRQNYTVVDTLIGRVISESVKVYSYLFPDYSTVSALSEFIKTYRDLILDFREETPKVPVRAGLVQLSSTRAWIEKVKNLLARHPPLTLISPLRPGEASDDLVTYITAEKVHYYACSLYVPEASEAFTRFARVDEDMLISHQLISTR